MENLELMPRNLLSLNHSMTAKKYHGSLNVQYSSAVFYPLVGGVGDGIDILSSGKFRTPHW